MPQPVEMEQLIIEFKAKPYRRRSRFPLPVLILCLLATWVCATIAGESRWLKSADCMELTAAGIGACSLCYIDDGRESTGRGTLSCSGCDRGE